MIAKYRAESLANKILTLAVLAAAIFFVCKIFYAAYLTLPYSRELLEPSNVALTNTFLEGKSPYSLSSLEWDVPGINYDYPFMNSLIAAAIAKIIGCGAVVAHLAISAFAILISGFIGSRIVMNHSKTTVAPAVAALMFMFCHWRFGYISAAPDDLGLMFMLLTLEAATSPKIKYKPVVCAIMITLCFYTKQYFVFVAVPVFIYMLLYSWREAVRLLICTLVLNIIAATLITVFWPLYWMRTIAFTYLGTLGYRGAGLISTLMEQLGYLAFSFCTFFAIVIVATVLGIRKLRKSGAKITSIRVKENDIFALSVINSIIMAVPLFFLGRNDGAFISYFLQLWMHSIVVVALVCFERMKPKPERYEYIYSGIYAVIIGLTVYLGFGRLPIHILTQDEIAQWQKAYEYTKKYSEDGDIFYSRSLAYDGFRRGNGQWQCGHEGEVSAYTIESLEMAGFPSGLFPNMIQLIGQNVSYRDNIVEKAENHGYSLITFEPDTDSSLFSEENCEQYGYKCIDHLNLQMGMMAYNVAFYALGGCQEQEREDIRLYVHRGYANLAPDCSRPAWELAKKLGYYGVECDIYSTTDNVFVVFHDDELDDLTNGTGPVTDKSWDEVSKIVFDAGANIEDYPDLHLSRIEELLQFVKDNDMHVLLDVKTVHSYRELAQMIVDYGIEDLCTVCSSSTEDLDEVRKVSSDISLRYWDGEDVHQMIDVASAYDKCDVSYPREDITEDIVDYAHKKGVKIGVYSWNTEPEPEGEYERLYDLGVDSATINTITTPDQAKVNE